MPIFLGVLFVIICILLVVVILLQKGRGGGLGAAFGGAGTSAFGTRTGDVLTWVTIVLVALFLLLCIVTTLVWRPPPETVATPEFSLPDGTTLTEERDVMIRCETQEAEIHYTTDESPPTRQSPLYEKSPVRVGPGTTLRAQAFRSAWKASLVASAHYPAPGPETMPAGPEEGTGPQAEPPTRPAEPASAPAARPPEPASRPAEPSTRPATAPATGPA